MRLPLLDPWYAEGLQFTCSQCGNCCTGGPGYVWISREEIARLAEFLDLSCEQVVERYCRKVDGQFTLQERRHGGKYDCIFLREEKSQRPAPDADGHDAAVLHTRRTCAIYPVRPLQCRTWPFWPENLRSRRNWNQASQRCPGMNAGRRFTSDEIARIRDAAEWPKDPPSST